jgi:alpha-glucosidase
VSIGEIHIFDWEAWATYYGEDLDELHMPFNFGLLNVDWRAQAVREVVDSLEEALPQGAWPNYVLGNHDEPRLASRYGREEARVAAMLLLTLRGTPTIYYGDEIGMVDVPIPPERLQDLWGETLPRMGRDPCRTPMQWTGGPNAGFSSPQTGALWLPLADDYEQVNVERELKEPASLLNLYRHLLAYRDATPALTIGGYEPLDGVPEACYVYLRETDEQRVLVVLNFSGRRERVRIAARGGGEIALSTHLDRSGVVDLGALPVRGNEGLIIELTRS